MSKRFLILLAAVTILSAAGSASAVTAKWCFKWKANYYDGTLGDHDDYLRNETTISGTDYSVIAAKYAYVMFCNWNALTQSCTTSAVWEYLDSSGCTAARTISSNTSYHFWQFLQMKRGDRFLHVMKVGENWNGYLDLAEADVTTGILLPTVTALYIPTPNQTTNTRLMPAITQVIANVGNTVDFPDPVHIDVLAESSVCGGVGTDYDEATGAFHICYGNSTTSNNDDKFQIAHELGHVVAKGNDGPVPTSEAGSEGIFNGGAICDCSEIDDGTAGHCPTSREFTGSAQGEGFANFVATASVNNRDETDTDEDGIGTMVYYKSVHEWTSNHGGTLPWPLLPDSDHQVEKYPANLGASHNVKWAYYECAPSGHFTTEWDWLDFYWGLWTDDANRYSVGEIDDVWSDTVTKDTDGDVTNDQIASYCCAAYDADSDPNHENWIPTSCQKRDKSTGCNNPSYPHRFNVGKLWNADSTFDVTVGLRNTVIDNYGLNTPKYNLFVSKGAATKVDY